MITNDELLTEIEDVILSMNDDSGHEYELNVSLNFSYDVVVIQSGGTTIWDAEDPDQWDDITGDRKPMRELIITGLTRQKEKTEEMLKKLITTK